MLEISPETTAPKARPEDFYDELGHTGPDTLGGRYLRQFWHPVARSQDLRPGYAKTIKILGENYTLYRGESGTAFITADRCPHRRVALGVGYVEGDSIRCIYHGWKFNESGRCTERPAEPGNPPSSVNIKTQAAREFLGLIYGYFGEGEPPAFPPYPEFAGEGIVEAMVAPYTCGYFQGWENDWDIYHAAWTHLTGELHGPSEMALRHRMFHSMLSTERYLETDYGIIRTMELPNGVMQATVFFQPATVRLHIPTFNELSRRKAGPPFRDSYIAHTPIDDENHLMFITQFVPVTGEAAEAYRKQYDEVQEMLKHLPSPVELGLEIIAGRTSLKDHKHYPELPWVEDLLAQATQGGVVDRRRERLASSDAGVVYLRRLMAREFQAMVEGRPTKSWRVMAEMPQGFDVELKG
jgi:5,5'-dehydrodivanillate O-demethylase